MFHSESKQALTFWSFMQSNKNLVWIISTIVTAIVAFVIGMIGFLGVSDPEFTLSSAIYGAFRLFVLDFDVPIEQPDYPLMLEVARWLAPATVFSSIILFIAMAFYQKFVLLSLKFRRNYTVICSLNPQSLTLANDLLQRKERVVIIDPDRDNPHLGSVLIRRGIAIIGSPLDGKILQTASVRRCKRVVLFSETDTDNIEALLRIKELCLPNRKHVNPKKIFIQLQDKQMDDVISEIEDILDKDKLELIPFNIHENAARLHFQKHPLYKNIDISLDGIAPHLLIVGFRAEGEQVLLQALQLAHYAHGKKLAVSVLDRDAANAEAELRFHYPEIHHIADIRFYSTYPTANDFRSTLESLQPTYAVVCLNADHQSLKVGIRLTELLPDIPVHTLLKEDTSYFSQIDQNNRKYRLLHRFGAMIETTGVDSVINEVTQLMAVQLHEAYIRIGRKDTPWSRLSMFAQSSNRAMADHIATKLRTLGLKYVPHSQQGVAALSEEAFHRLAGPLLEKLARCEHERWNAFHYVHGWRSCSSEQWKDEERKLHPTLVSWEELDAVSECHSRLSGKDIKYKEYDINTIRDLWLVLHACGYSIIHQ